MVDQAQVQQAHVGLVVGEPYLVGPRGMEVLLQSVLGYVIHAGLLRLEIAKKLRPFANLPERIQTRHPLPRQNLTFA